MKSIRCSFAAFAIGTVIALGAFHVSGLDQGRHEKRKAKLEESAKPRSVSGGVTFQSETPYDKAYDAVLNYLKRDRKSVV